MQAEPVALISIKRKRVSAARAANSREAAIYVPARDNV